MSDLESYIKQFVEPTVDDFKRNPISARHAYLACVVVYHAVDRMPQNPTRQWHNDSKEFLIVDMVANHFKHVESMIEKKARKNPQSDAIPLPYVVFGDGSGAIDQLELRNLFYVIQEAVKFLYTQI